GRMTPFALINPRAEGAAARADDLLGAQGFKGLLFFPAMHGFDPAGPEAAAVFEVADRHGACAVVHCGLLQVKLRDLLGIPRQLGSAVQQECRGRHAPRVMESWGPPEI